MEKQARKPRSYTNSKLRQTERPAGVMFRATRLAKMTNMRYVGWLVGWLVGVIAQWGIVPSGAQPHSSTLLQLIVLHSMLRQAL